MPLRSIHRFDSQALETHACVGMTTLHAVRIMHLKLKRRLEDTYVEYQSVILSNFLAFSQVNADLMRCEPRLAGGGINFEHRAYIKVGFAWIW